MVDKRYYKFTLSVSAAFIAALSGSCPGFSAETDDTPALSAQDQPVSEQSAKLARPGAPMLRFKKEDFVPIPDMAPMPLDAPTDAPKKPLQVNIPNLETVRPPPVAHETLNVPQAPVAAAAPNAQQKGFFGRLVSHLTPPKPKPDDATAPADSHAAVLQQLFGGEHETTAQVPAPAAQPQSPVTPSVYDSPGIIIKRETIHLAPPPGSDVALNNIVPQLPLPPDKQQLAALTPAAGSDAPLIPLSDLPPDTSPPPPSPPKPATAPLPPVAAAPLSTPPPIAMPPLPSTPIPEAQPPSTTEDITPHPEKRKPKAKAVPKALEAKKTGMPPLLGASVLPPPPSIAAAPVATTGLPPNVPAYAVQHWSGPDAITADATAALPPSVLAPIPLLSIPKQETSAEKMPPVPTSPAPPVAQADTRPLPALNAPVATEAADATEPKRMLSDESKQIVHKLETRPRPKQPSAAKPVLIDHSRDLTGLDQKSATVDKAVSHETQGVKIEIKPATVNYDYELDKAYTALIGGQSEIAIGIYKRVLDNNPTNKNALFGLATAYHRAGQIDLARPIYARLLAVDPGNSDGLNNFLVLLADEAPEEALVELQKLADRNPQYSALPAQIAVIYQKLGMYDKAGDYMLRAMAMAPENITYRYNFAIMLDKQKKYDEAAKLYRQIVQAYQRGEVIPGNIQKIQQRLTFISSNRPVTP